MMLKSFFYGIISASGVTIFQQIVLIVLGVEFIDTNQLSPLLIFGAFSEEIFKLLFIYKLRTETQNFKKMLFGSFLIGFGFSLVEITFKLLSNLESFGFSLNSYLGIVLLHILTAGIIGSFLTLKLPLCLRIILGTSLAFLLHLTYNYFQIYIF